MTSHCVFLLKDDTSPLKKSVSNDMLPSQFGEDGTFSLPNLNKSLEEAIKEKILSPVKMSPRDPPTEVQQPPTIKWKWMDPVTKREYGGTKVVSDHAHILEHRKRLPIYEFRTQFLNAVENHQVVVVVGETGSGKSTQMPQYLLESGVVFGGRVAITQPRRVAAVSVSQRVAEEMDCKVGELVGYSIRFEDVTSSNTVIKYMTDGLLLMECLKDPTFAAYGCVILDEAHERTLHTDVLLGLLKKALRSRADLKVVITSATLDIKKFADYFNAPMVKIPGKMFPVTIEYLAGSQMGGGRQPSLWSKAKKTEIYVEFAVNKVLQIHQIESLAGDILLFLPGKEEVEQACFLLSKSSDDDFLILPVYAALPFAAQCEIFNEAPKGRRKVVVATNIAETSLTIDGILHVVDTGFFKESISDHDIETLKVTVISKAQAEQRAGRAGRTAPGKCYRLYMLEDYESMPMVPAPAIHRIDFTATALQLKVMGIDDICGFGFMDPPKPCRVDHAFGRLRDLGALDRYCNVTELGYKMAEFPLSPNLAKVLLIAADMSCSDEVLTIVSMLSANNYIFVRPKRRQREADLKKMRFNDYKGDHLTLLNVYSAWKRNDMSEEWTRENFINQKEMEKAFDIRNQLLSIMSLHGVPVLSCDGRHLSSVRRALSTGLPNNVAYRDPSAPGRGGYRTLLDHCLVYIHPSSALIRQNPDLVIFHETVTTSRTFMRVVSVCERQWIPYGARRQASLFD